MILNLSYRSINLDRIVFVDYDDVAHVITNGALGGSEGISGIGPGVEFYRQTVGTDNWSIRVQDTVPYAYVFYFSTAIAQDLFIDAVNVIPAMNGANGSITVTASGTGTKRYSIGGAPQVSNVFLNVPPGTYVLTLSRTEDSYTVSQLVTVPAIANLQATVVATPCTANGADDGKVTVTNLTGSGNYSINFITEGVIVPSDGSAPVVRVSLAPGVYLVEITDVVTGQVQQFQVTVTEPDIVAPPVSQGTIFDVPLLNSIRFVIDNTDEEQGLDNVLLCNQTYGMYDQENYFQKYNKADKPKVQFYSNFPNHDIELRKYSNDAFVKGFPVIKVESNIGKIDTFVVSLVEGNPGQTKIYFDTAEIPVPLSVGDIISLSDNIAFDGDYAIVAIEFDEGNNSQYLIITKAFGAPASTIANINIPNNTIAYDVYEIELTFNDVASGQYYLFLRGFSGPNNIRTATSEPVEIATKHEGVILIVYNNFDNAFGVTWSTGYVGFNRIDGAFGHKRPTNGERTISRDADYSITKVSARKTRALLVEMEALPPYMYEKLSVVFDTDVFSINNVPCQSSEDLQSENVSGSILVNSSIIVEQLNWFSKYNSNDDLMSTVSETADCACDDIDLVPVSTSPATVTLNFNGKRQRIFKLQPAFSTNKTIALAAASLALAFKLKFEVTQAFIDNGQYIQFPASFQSNGVPLWDSGTKRFTPLDAGLYEAEASFDGSNWQIIFNQSTFN